MTNFIIISFAAGTLGGAFIVLLSNYERSIKDFVYRSLGKFDSNGLRYSHQHLNKLMPDIVFWSAEEQSKYVDQVVHDYVHDVHDWMVRPIGFDPIALGEHFNKDGTLRVDSFDMQRVNATALGNMAYLYIHASSQQVRDQAQKILAYIRKYYQDLQA
jgi:hypothetical protein